MRHNTSQIHRLTLEMARRFDTMARVALNGEDGSACSIASMRKSCFATENCTAGRESGTSLESMAQQPYAWIAILDDQFTGCVTAAPLSASTMKMFYRGTVLPPTNTLLLSNLCVDEAHRGMGIGRDLVDAVRSSATSHGLPPSAVYLLVDRSGLAHHNSDVVTAYGERVTRLHDTYATLGFSKVKTCDRYDLFACHRDPHGSSQ